MTDRDQQQAIMQAQARAHADLVNAVNGFRATLIDATRAIQKAAVEPFVDTGGQTGGTFEFTLDKYNPNPLVTGQAGWVTILRHGQKHEAPRSISLYAQPGLWYGGAGTGAGATLLGIVARVRSSIGCALQNEMIIDVPSNGIVTVPLVAGEVTVDVMLTQVAYSVTEIQGGGSNGWNPDAPFARKPNFSNPQSSTTNPVVISGVTPHHALSRPRLHLPSRSVVVQGQASDGAFDLPIPRGAQTILLNGPADLGATQRDITGNSANVAMPMVINTEYPLLPGAQIIEMASAGGGYMSATFYMGS